MGISPEDFPAHGVSQPQPRENVISLSHLAPRAASGRQDEQLALAQLVRDIHERRGDAFDRFYDCTVDRVFTLAYHLLKNRQDAEEAVSEVYLCVWRQAHLYRAERGRVLAWLLTLCRSRALDMLRRQRAHQRLDARIRDNGHDGGESPSVHDAMFDPARAVTDALLALPPVRRQILALSFCKGLTHREIAAELSLPLGSVKSHLRRAIDELRATIGVRLEQRT